MLSLDFGQNEAAVEERGLTFITVKGRILPAEQRNFKFLIHHNHRWIAKNCSSVNKEPYGFVGLSMFQIAEPD